MKLYPKYVGVYPGVKSKLCDKIIKNIQAGNPKAVIKQNTKSIPFPLPTGHTRGEKSKLYRELCKDSLIIRNKQGDENYGNLRFVHVFVSVNTVVESLKIIIGGENECPMNCNFCYLQGSFDQQPIPTVFANFQDEGLLLREIKISLMALRLYLHLNNVTVNIGRDGQNVVHKLSGLLNSVIGEVSAEESVKNIFTKHKEKFKKELKSSKLRLLKPFLENIDNFTFEDTSRKIQFNCGEINDALCYDHLNENGEFLINIFSHEVMKNDGAYLMFRTKSDNVDNLLKLNPNDNVKVSLTITTDAFVQKVPTASDRINAATKLIEKGYAVGFNFDPMILYPDTVKIYSRFLVEIHEKVDYASDKFQSITFGFLRFGVTNIKGNIKFKYPGLYGHFERNMIKEKGDEKYRYQRDKRIEIYKGMVAKTKELFGDNVKIKISTEDPDIWEDVGVEY
jgi:DNA repair photolyase